MAAAASMSEERLLAFLRRRSQAELAGRDETEHDGRRQYYALRKG